MVEHAETQIPTTPLTGVLATNIIYTLRCPAPIYIYIFENLLSSLGSS